jgi:hypothetical protein
MNYDDIEQKMEYASTIFMPDVTLWISSYGGSGTNFLYKVLQSKHLCYTENWVQYLCHAYTPIVSNIVQKSIFVYAHPIVSILCQQVRVKVPNGFASTLPINYLKISQGKMNHHLPFSIDNFIRIIIEQMHNWKYANVNYPILLLRYETIEQYKHELDAYCDIGEFEFIPRKTKLISVDNFCDKVHCSKDLIEQAIQMYESLPDFEIRDSNIC